MTTEPKAEGGEAVGWVFQHDETGRMTFCPNDGVNTPEVFAKLNPGYTLCSAAYTHPTPSAVEELARADAEYDAAHIEYLDALPDDYYTPQGQCYLADDHPAQVRWDAARQRRSAALAHPAIAALLGEMK